MVQQPKGKCLRFAYWLALVWLDTHKNVANMGYVCNGV